MEKLWGVLVSLSVALAILSPLKEEWRGIRGDSFPLSWYPMFSRPRPDPESTNYIVGIEKDGTRHIIRSDLYVPGGMNQARRQLSTLVSSSKSARETCEKAAKAVARHSSGELRDVRELRLVRGYYHMKKYFGDGIKTPEREQVHARCIVKRSGVEKRQEERGQQ
jgi:hypothetical protein